MPDPAHHDATTTADPSLATLPTPWLVLDQFRFERNVATMKQRLAPLNVGLRPHLKTAKSIDVARRVLDRPTGPAAVSTLKEAEYFAAHGITDMIYAVGIAPSKLDRVGAIRDHYGADLAVIAYSREQAVAIAEWSARHNHPLPTLIEIDCDGHRSGIRPDGSERLLSLGGVLHTGGAALRGVLTHAGDSYDLSQPDALAKAAEAERLAVVRAASTLRDGGLPCPVVSVGATPTARSATDLTGVTEVRAGVFMFFDLVQAGVGVCRTDDIAVSVLATVIGHQSEKNLIIVDAGWMALSRDRGTSSQAIDQGYGVVCDLGGVPYPDLLVMKANQEHGLIGLRSGSRQALPPLPLGARVRILPNHACATGAQHDSFHVIDQHGALIGEWPRIRGW